MLSLCSWYLHTQSLEGEARYGANKDSLVPQTRSEQCLLTWVELLVGMTVAVPVSRRINHETLTSPEIQNSQLRDMVWTAIKAPAIYTLTHTKLLLTSFRLKHVLRRVVQCEPQGIH